MNSIFNAIAGFLSGVLGSMGLGGGGILIIYLNLFENTEQTMAQGINLLFFIPSAIIAIIYYILKKLINFKAVGFMTITGLIGAFIGASVSSVINPNILGKMFAVLLLIMGIRQLLNKS